MTSTITNYSTLIDTTFPVPGVDNDTQGFRNNSINIQQAFGTAAAEITNLQIEYGGLVTQINEATVIGSNFAANIAASVTNVVLGDLSNYISGIITGTTSTFVISNTTTSVSTNTGALQVAGGAGIAGDLYIGGQLNVGSGSVSTATNLNGGATGSIPFQSNPGQTSMLSIGSAGSLLQSNGTTAIWTNSNSYVYTITNSTPSVSPTTGALQVAGGAGILGDLFVGGNLNIGGSSNITITGSISTATNLGGGAAGQIVYQSAFGVTNYAGPGSVGQILISNGTAGPSFVNTGSLLVGSSINILGGSQGSIHIQSGSGQTSFIPIGASGSLLQSNGTTATWSTASSITVGSAGNLSFGSAGSIPIQTSAGQTSFIPIGTSGSVLQSNGATAAWVAANTLSVASATNAVNANNITGGSAGSLLIQSGAGATSSIPIGATGSLLQSNGTTATWVSAASLGVGNSRVTVTGSSTPLAPNTTGTINISGSKFYLLCTAKTNVAAWVRLYTDATSLSNDSGRSRGTNPLSGSGVLAEIITTNSSTQLITPVTFGFNNDTVTSSTIYCAVTNLSGSTSTVTVSLNILSLEV